MLLKLPFHKDDPWGVRDKKPSVDNVFQFLLQSNIYILGDISCIKTYSYYIYTYPYVSTQFSSYCYLIKKSTLETRILKYLSKYIKITDDIESAVKESAFLKSYKKGTILLKEGDHSYECYFILEGCIRSYFLKEGEEITVEFYTEEEVVTPANLGKPISSQYYLECIEDTVVNVANPGLEKEMFQKYPQLESLSRVIAEVILVKQQRSFTKFKTSNPEERYLNLVKTRPDLLQRASQHQIASYLGIKPESLSRIKKRILTKK